MEIIDIIFYPSIVATGASVVGLFASGEWKSLSKEMELYELGKVAYVMTIVWAAIAWQVISMVLAIWGVVSYVNQQYLDESKPEDEF
ncbi:hypothetical protein Pint_10057 [Pistacia integerrima]|uniref:Uncharacterized protein n=1 Tax=Pistacia integerrima TaxID=434235 RepID=A0ACC0XMI2_9ROSI|nr:hypothetical protein Pint_10057 [Pistacia integerrima]